MNNTSAPQASPMRICRTPKKINPMLRSDMLAARPSLMPSRVGHCMIRTFPERVMRRAIRICGVLIFFAVCGHASDTQVSFVPWKVLEPGAAPLKTAFVLNWVPASPTEMRHSELITSRRLALYAARCIGMQVIRTDDSVMLVKLRAAETLPFAVLCEGDKEIARVL